MTKKSNNVPFKTNGEYLDQEFAWLKCYVNLLEVQKNLAESRSDTSDYQGNRVGAVTQLSFKELTRQVSELQALENDLRSNLEKRLETHREHGDFTLGLDCICESHNLSGDERRILLALTLPAISASQACDILAPYNLYNGILAVQDLMELFHPGGTEDYLGYRNIFQVGSPLIKENLITLNYPTPHDHPAAIHSADVTLTSKAFSCIVGMPSLAEGSLDTGSDGDME